MFNEKDKIVEGNYYNDSEIIKLMTNHIKSMFDDDEWTKLTGSSDLQKALGLSVSSSIVSEVMNMGNNQKKSDSISRCRLVGVIEFFNGRTKKIDKSVPIDAEDVNILNIKKFFNENPSINRDLISKITGKCYDLQTGEEIKVILL